MKLIDGIDCERQVSMWGLKKIILLLDAKLTATQADKVANY
jgi:hypothetical protein